MDFFAQASILKDMINDDEIDPVKVRTGLFALITARLEDAHEVAVKGQSAKIDEQLVARLTSDLQANMDEIRILLSAVAVV